MDALDYFYDTSIDLDYSIEVEKALIGFAKIKCFELLKTLSEKYGEDVLSCVNLEEFVN
jgi:hypothetical protein